MTDKSNVDLVVGRFPGDVAAHELTVLHDDGLHRHLRFGKPGTYSMSFSVITWPGGLLFTGDMGSFAFERVQDMLSFFRHSAPNYGYWAEKCVAQDREGVRRYSPDLFERKARELFDEVAAEMDEQTRAAVLDTFADAVLRCSENEHDARAALDEFDEHGVSFTDTWELSFNDYTYRFAWCCNALVWAVQRYDRWIECAKEQGK